MKEKDEKKCKIENKLPLKTDDLRRHRRACNVTGVTTVTLLGSLREKIRRGVLIGSVTSTSPRAALHKSKLQKFVYIQKESNERALNQRAVRVVATEFILIVCNHFFAN